MNANHLPTCTRYCAKQHCACGRDAAHGQKTCLSCSRFDHPVEQHTRLSHDLPRTLLTIGGEVS